MGPIYHISDMLHSEVMAPDTTIDPHTELQDNVQNLTPNLFFCFGPSNATKRSQ